MSRLGIFASSYQSSFNPLTLPNLKAWFDASDTTSISVSGSSVTQWNDKSGNGYHLSQSTGTYQPASGTRTWNGKNVIDFADSSTKSLYASTASNWKFLNDGSKSSVFIAVKLDGSGTTRTNAMIYTRGGSLSEGAGYTFQAQDTSKMLNGVNITNSNICLNTSTSSITGSGVCWTVLTDPSNSTAANKSDIRKNTGSAEKNNTTTGTAQDSNPAQPLRVSDYTQGGTLAIQGVVGEIIMCSGLLGTTDITNVQNYLIAKWGIS